MLGHLPNRKRSNLLLKKKKKKYRWYSIHLAEIHVCFCKLTPYYQGSEYFLSFPGFIVQLQPVLSVHSCFNVYRAVIFSDRCPAAPMAHSIPRNVLRYSIWVDNFLWFSSLRFSEKLHSCPTGQDFGSLPQSTCWGVHLGCFFVCHIHQPAKETANWCARELVRFRYLLTIVIWMMQWVVISVSSHSSP